MIEQELDRIDTALQKAEKSVVNAAVRWHEVRPDGATAAGRLDAAVRRLYVARKKAKKERKSVSKN